MAVRVPAAIAPHASLAHRGGGSLPSVSTPSESGDLTGAHNIACLEEEATSPKPLAATAAE